LETLADIAVQGAKTGQSMVSSTRKAVVFDLGGVLARICHTWEEAADVAGVPHDISPGGHTPLANFSGFDLYQAGTISFDIYLKELALFLGCSEDDAPKVHNSIIVEEYPGVAELIRELRQRGYRLGCLSNTNTAHWEHLALNGSFPTIESLEMKMASHLVGLNKPDPAIFRLYASEFGLQPRDIYYFDDHPLNVEAARAEGWAAARITPGDDTAHQMRTALMSWHLL
jgi:putative hydrolase of the HAD superfamily